MNRIFEEMNARSGLSCFIQDVNAFREEIERLEKRPLEEALKKHQISLLPSDEEKSK